MLDLTSEFDRLNAEQKAAVEREANTAVLAGPGSGKTATLVLKIAHLLASGLQGPRTIGCITFNNDAVAEFRQRLGEFGVHAGRQLFLGTVHSFCLNSLLRPYASLIEWPYASGVEVAKPRDAAEILTRCFEEHMPEVNPSWEMSTVTRFRRAAACTEDTRGFDDRMPALVRAYEAELAESGLVDFDAMVFLALRLLRDYPWVLDLVVSRYPWLIVDEYQDLGGPLHHIVTLLADAGVQVFAVGDPDQTIYDFTGADPTYLRSFAARPDVEEIRLRFNYRSGQSLIRASEAALGEDRHYLPDPNRETDGEVVFHEATSKMSSHASNIIEAVEGELAAGTPPHEIAVLYLRKTLLLEELEFAFEEAGIPYKAERATRFNASPITRWLQRAACWSLGYDETFEELYRYYQALLVTAGRIAPGEASLGLRRELSEALEASRDNGLEEWINHLDARLDLRATLKEAMDRPDELEAFDELRAEAGDAQVPEFAADGVRDGKVVITTFHSCKGRQFDAVMIPGLAEGIVPSWKFNRRSKSYEQPNAKWLLEQRRLFYVGFTRARHRVHLVCSDAFSNKWYTNRFGVSRFAMEISERLKSGR